MNTLYIDTTSNQVISVCLRTQEKKSVLKRKLHQHKAQIVLPLIDTLLKKHSLQLQDINAIEVCPGPGSFTGVRVGISVANALAFALGVSVNGSKNPVEPVYES